MPDPAPSPHVGHVHLKASDLERAERFYVDLLGMHVMQRWPGAVFLSFDGSYHHHVALNAWQSQGAAPPPSHSTGLFHAAFVFPDRASLARVVQRIVDSGYPLDGAADHGVSEAIYLRDPEGNSLELYWDRPREAWPLDGDGNVAMFTKPLDVEGLLVEAR